MLFNLILTTVNEAGRYYLHHFIDEMLRQREMKQLAANGHQAIACKTALKTRPSCHCVTIFYLGIPLLTVKLWDNLCKGS